MRTPIPSCKSNSIKLAAPGAAVISPGPMGTQVSAGFPSTVPSHKEQYGSSGRCPEHRTTKGAVFSPTLSLPKRSGSGCLLIRLWRRERCGSEKVPDTFSSSIFQRPAPSLIPSPLSPRWPPLIFPGDLELPGDMGIFWRASISAEPWSCSKASLRSTWPTGEGS